MICTVGRASFYLFFVSRFSRWPTRSLGFGIGSRIRAWATSFIVPGKGIGMPWPHLRCPFHSCWHFLRTRPLVISFSRWSCISAWDIFLGQRGSCSLFLHPDSYFFGFCGGAT